MYYCYNATQHKTQKTNLEILLFCFISFTCHTSNSLIRTLSFIHHTRIIIDEFRAKPLLFTCLPSSGGSFAKTLWVAVPRVWSWTVKDDHSAYIVERWLGITWKIEKKSLKICVHELYLFYLTLQARPARPKMNLDILEITDFTFFKYGWRFQILSTFTLITN